MNRDKESFFITTPIYYVNDKPHLGTAYSTLLADGRARFERLVKKDVFFLTGTDEHGEKIAQSAEKHEMSAQEWTDSMIPAFKDLWEKLNFSNDDFIRTTQDRHTVAVQKILEELKDKNAIYKDKYTGWYCVHEETHFTETQVHQYNEEKGKPEEHMCPDCDRELERVEEDSWFFRLSDYQDKLLSLYEEHPEFIEPEIRRNEVVSFVKGGLNDLSISRTSFSWGIPFSFDEEHVTYVWIDALINYLTAIGYGDESKAEELAYRWPADVHIVGKDIIRFHCVIWPAILMALGLEVPKRVFVHGFLLINGKKMSKSRGNAIDPYDLIKIFGSEAYRYYFLTDITHGADSSISIERMAQVYNADLANSWGNLVSRALNMSDKYFDGKTPGITDEQIQKTNILSAKIEKLYQPYCEAMEEMQFGKAAALVLEVIDAANLYIEQTTPWNLAKMEGAQEELAFVIYNILEAIRIVAYFYLPFMPKISQEVLSRLSEHDLSASLEDFARWGQLKQGVEVHKGEALFPRLDVEKLSLNE
ncbi:MAG: methionine--tRNA ligase [Coriobacteriia bacterium]|nr:methionine--tRNA ligase [Coriobacteriia bacterium]